MDKSIVRKASAVVMAVALIGAASVAPAAQAASPSQRGSGGTLKLLWWQAPTILNTHLAQGTKDQDASRLVYEPLATFDKAGKLVPILAASIPKPAADGKSVTWKLKPNVKWSDGTPFTAEDVKFTFDYMSNKDTGATTASNVSAVESIEVVDPLTVKINFKEPNPAWSTPFVGATGLIIPKHIFQDFIGAKSREAPANLKPVGTGAFQVVEFKPGDTVIYEANPNFREPNKPIFGRVELKGGGDATSAARAVLQTGDYDFAWNLQVEAAVLNQLAAAGKGKLLPVVGSNVEQLLLNQTDPNKEVDGERSSVQAPHPFLTDKRVRQAISLAVDRKTIVEQIYGAAGKVTSNVVTVPPTVASKNTTADFNLEQAKALLDQAGWKDTNGDGVREKDGVEMKVLYQTSVNPVRQKTQAIIKQALESIGFKVELKSIDAGTFFASDPGNTDTAGHFYADIQMFTTGSAVPDPADFLENWTTAQIAQKANNWSGNNYVRWSNPAYDALFEKQKTELNAAKRNQMLIQLNDLIVKDFIHVPIVSRPLVMGVGNAIAGVDLTPWDATTWQVKDWSRK